MVDVFHRGGWPSQEHHIDLVEIDPDRMSGRPTIRGTRVPVETVALAARTPAGREELRDDFGIGEAEIQAALDWWVAAEAAVLAGAA
jgi:uncharacterized protein (DUF433 family)